MDLAIFLKQRSKYFEAKPLLQEQTFRALSTPFYVPNKTAVNVTTGVGWLLHYAVYYLDLYIWFLIFKVNSL